MDLEKFQDDVYKITERLSIPLSENDLPKLNYVRQRLIEMYTKNLVKINHSVLELICAANLISRGYTVEVEKPVSKTPVCDIFAKKGAGSTIIEIETGFTPLRARSRRCGLLSLKNNEQNCQVWSVLL